VSANDVTGRDTSPRNQRVPARQSEGKANGNDRAGRDNGKTTAPAKESGGPDDRA
jgi:hypothetical protein